MRLSAHRGLTIALLVQVSGAMHAAVRGAGRGVVRARSSLARSAGPSAVVRRMSAATDAAAAERAAAVLRRMSAAPDAAAAEPTAAERFAADAARAALSAQFAAHVLYADNHVVAFNKPPGILSQGDRTGDDSVNELALAWLMETRSTKFGAVTHRLDRPVSGAMLVACTTKAAQRLSSVHAEGAAKKTYLAAVSTRGQKDIADEAWLVDALVPAKDAAQAARKVKAHRVRASAEPLSDVDYARLADEAASKYGKGTKLAVLHFRVLARRSDGALLQVTLERTGRRHQIRAQLAAANAPIIGDRKYGHRDSALDGGRAMALHAATLDAPHPIKDKGLLRIVAPLPNCWRSGEVDAKLVAAADAFLAMQGETMLVSPAVPP
ncbi:pseudouridine synthase [Pelagophyceae sp. CCMP2097]|nr:pseudouridine synthase [Pelagophyceae sp. CCMP2097]